MGSWLFRIVQLIKTKKIKKTGNRLFGIVQLIKSKKSQGEVSFMPKNTFKIMVCALLCNMVAVSAVTANPNGSVNGKKIAQGESFNCGPHTLTFEVKSLGGAEGKGVRCVKLSNGTNPITPSLAWYGEGNWGGSTYRHVGHAFLQGNQNVLQPNRPLRGSASDIFGNGEDIRNNFNGNLQISLAGGTWSNPTALKVTGAWNEIWYRRPSVNYTPLSAIKTCGSYFDEYKVSDLNGSRNGSGVRCVLKVGRTNTTWVGSGEWGGDTYSHLGTRSSAGFGASDLCGGNFGTICNDFSYGSLQFTRTRPRGFDVTNAWSEKWR